MKDIGAQTGQTRRSFTGGSRTSPAFWILLLLVLAGAVLRLYRLGAQSYWVDELLTIGAAEVGGRLGAREFFTNIQGPFHALIVHLVSRASTSEFALRVPSALAGVAAIPALYHLGKELFDRRVGCVAALLATVSPFAVWYSQEVRSYSLLMLLSAASTYFLYRAVSGERRSWVPYAATIVLGIYCSLTAVFLAAGHGLYALWHLRRRRGGLSRALLVFAVVIALVSPLSWGMTRWAQKDDPAGNARFAPQSEAADLLRGETTFSPLALPYSIFVLGYGYSLGPGMRELHESPPEEGFRRHAALVVPAGLILATALALGLVRTARRRGLLGLTLLAAAVPIGASVVLALANIKPTNARYIAVIFPIVIVTAAAGVSSVRRFFGGLLCAALVVFCGVALWGYYGSPAYWKADVRAAARYIEARERPGDVVLVPVVRDVFNFYYSGGSQRFVVYRGQAGSDQEVEARIRAGAAGAERLWFVDARLWSVDPGRRIPTYLDSRYRRLESVSFPGASLALYSLWESVEGERAISGAGPESASAADGRSTEALVRHD